MVRASFQGVVAAAVAALPLPWLVVACDLVPSAVPPGTGGGASSSGVGASGGTSSAASSSSTTAATTSSTGGPGGAGGQPGTGGQADASGGGGGASSSGVGGSMMDAGDAAAPVMCDTTVTKYPIDPSPHIPVCFPIVYSTNPPTSGPHYPIWAAFKTYATPVPQGFYVHDLEHGAIVITYHCPGGCDAELAQLAAYLDTRPADPLCSPPVKSRVVVTPDAHLDALFAASAWGWALKSNCFDLAMLGPFMDAHYAHATENFCVDGIDVTAPDAGIPADCGQAAPDGGP